MMRATELSLNLSLNLEIEVESAMTALAAMSHPVHLILSPARAS